ncbi:uncharacterized protein LAJ45_05512 [Morchella importuna]|uniref:Uncharacterized protein n=1 Tax=Morchella conica CCBAS932 TaxID=1392247 RepID=A0A3N4KZZ8_9PEZI|nr:uncharacterized protein LAJ45_05512 [Morchella importuna]KAH8150301.1 hypothetical protein LAJ45_05512 [Morchella importuna]RPB13911.1 hypothetical protein P167DRAFT_572838 [Morchella conica CCBAS932]
MCFVTINRWRSCQHDERTKIVTAFCTNAKASARAGASSAGPRYCGRGMCSPQYINEYDSDDPSGGVCPDCTTEMEEAERHNQQEQPPGDGSDASTPTSQRTGPEIFQVYQNYRADNPLPNVTSPLPPRQPFPPWEESLSRPVPLNIPVVMPQQYYQPYLQAHLHPASRLHPPGTPPVPPPRPNWSFIYNLKNAGRENSATSSGSWSSNIVHRVSSNYPQRTRVAIEQAVANQTPERRAELLRGYANMISMSFE